jgi:hypothetical protein
MDGAILPLPQYVFMAWGLVKHRDNFILPLLNVIFAEFKVYKNNDD